MVDGKVWSCTIPVSVLPEYEHKLQIINLRNENENNVSIRFLAEKSVVANAVQVVPRLEDLYLYLFPQETPNLEVR